MKTLFATCGVVALALLAAGCGRQGPHGPPKVQGSQPTEQTTVVVYPQGQVDLTLAQGPHGPPRVLRRSGVVQTEPTLYDDILDSTRLTPAVRDCKIQHLSNYRISEKKWRKSGDALDDGELAALEAWLNIIIHKVYPEDDDIPEPPDATLPKTPPSPAQLPACAAW